MVKQEKFELSVVVVLSVVMTTVVIWGGLKDCFALAFLKYAASVYVTWNASEPLW